MFVAAVGLISVLASGAQPATTPGVHAMAPGPRSQTSDAFDIPRISWPPVMNWFAPVPGLPRGASGDRKGDPLTSAAPSVRPVCTVRIVPADPHVDTEMTVPVKREVDSRMIVPSRCAE